MKTKSLRATFEQGLDLAFRKWTEPVFMAALLTYQHDVIQAAHQCSSTLFADLVRFRQWHLELCEARDVLPVPTAEDLHFDRALDEAFQRHEQQLAAPPADSFATITIAIAGDVLRVKAGARGRPLSFGVKGGSDALSA